MPHARIRPPHPHAHACRCETCTPPHPADPTIATSALPISAYIVAGLVLGQLLVTIVDALTAGPGALVGFGL